MVVEEAPQPTVKTAEVDRPLHILTLSARTEAALADLVGRHVQHLAVTDVPLADLCHTANVGRSHFEHRLAIVAGSTAEVRDLLTATHAGREACVHRGKSLGTAKPRVAFLFPGEGSPYIGMGRKLFETQPTFRAALLRCEELLKSHFGWLLTDELFEDVGRLGRPALAQPTLFALEYALAELWQSWGFLPHAVLGHGVGEYVAACVAGVFSLEDGLVLVAERGRRMEGVPTNGTHRKDASAPTFGRPRLGLVSSATGRLFADVPDAAYWREQTRQPDASVTASRLSPTRAVQCSWRLGHRPVSSTWPGSAEDSTPWCRSATGAR